MGEAMCRYNSYCFFPLISMFVTTLIPSLQRLITPLNRARSLEKICWYPGNGSCCYATGRWSPVVLDTTPIKVICHPTTLFASKRCVVVIEVSRTVDGLPHEIYVYFCMVFTFEKITCIYSCTKLSPPE
jgi:hypothetical protein